MGLLKDFKDFALKGNVIDLAIGVIIGAAFGKIVCPAWWDDILMPPLGALINGIDFSKLVVKVADGPLLADGKMGEPVVIRYGNFIQISIQFMIVAFVIFLITQAIVRMNKSKEEALAVPPAVPEASAEEKLLSEIRDLLKAGR